MTTRLGNGRLALVCKLIFYFKYIFFIFFGENERKYPVLTPLLNLRTCIPIFRDNSCRYFGILFSFLF